MAHQATNSLLCVYLHFLRPTHLAKEHQQRQVVADLQHAADDEGEPAQSRSPSASAPPASAILGWPAAKDPNAAARAPIKVYVANALLRLRSATLSAGRACSSGTKIETDPADGLIVPAKAMKKNKATKSANAKATPVAAINIDAAMSSARVAGLMLRVVSQEAEKRGHAIGTEGAAADPHRPGGRVDGRRRSFHHRRAGRLDRGMIVLTRVLQTLAATAGPTDAD